MKTQDRVIVNEHATGLGGIFVGKTGEISTIEKDGRCMMFRVKFDSPVIVENVGTVKSDLFPNFMLNKVR